MNGLRSLLHVLTFNRLVSFTLKVASGALNYVAAPPVMYFSVVQHRLFRIVKTMGTDPMWWVRSLTRFFQRIHVAPIPRRDQLIALLLFFPCLRLGKFIFKMIDALNHRELFRLSRKRIRLSPQEWRFEDR